MMSDDRLLSIYVCLEPRRNHNQYQYLLATISVLQKHSKFERMSCCNYSFIIKKGNSSNGWLQLNLQINSIPMKKGMTASALLKRNTVPLKILDHCKSPPDIMMAPLKCMAVSAFLKHESALNRNICQVRLIYATAASYVQR